MTRRARISRQHSTHHDSNEGQLVGATRRGGITLVLGAGLSIPRGIPDWNTLAQQVWRHSFPRHPNPWSSTKDSSSQDLPQFLPIIFELAHRELGVSAFLDLLKRALYENANCPFTDARFPRSKETLAVLARLLVSEHKRGAARRITSVITLNADDFLEQAVARLSGVRDDLIESDVVRAISRSTHRFPGPSTIPIYHIHGFLPSDLWRSDEGPKRMLVFTDLQYWSSSARASSFANRIMSTALSEGQCVFIGVSMKDTNVLRWLALRSLDRERDQIDFGQERLARWISQRNSDHPREVRELLDTVVDFLKDPSTSESRSLDKNFSRHFWIRPPTTDPGLFLSDFLYRCRGVQPVDIEDWQGPSLQRLLTKCFPKKM
jgi:hypothetical protein